MKKKTNGIFGEEFPWRNKPGGYPLCNTRRTAASTGDPLASIHNSVEESTGVAGAAAHTGARNANWQRKMNDNGTDVWHDGCVARL